MKILNAIALVLATLTLSSTAFAVRDALTLKVFDTLLEVGVEPSPGMSQTRLLVENIECSYSSITHESSCNMTDRGPMGWPTNVSLIGEKAEKLANLLFELGAPSDAGMGKVYVGLKSLRCGQVSSGVMPGSSELERTNCRAEPDQESK